MSLRSALIAASAFVAATNAHITISNPVPYTADQVKIDKAAITAEQFPCKAQYGFTVTTMNNMKVGEPQKLEFDGSAVHGGGSCQLSYTQDAPPTPNSKFKVIKSIEGGCPGVNGASSFDFTLPASIPNGKGTFAWSWFAKMSGAPEFYMNCAPIDVTGGASDGSGLDALPDIFVANIGSTTCKSPLNKSVKFPNPGSELEDGGTADTEAPTGECGAAGPAPAPGGSTPPASPPANSPPAASPPAASAPAASAPAASAPAASAPAGEHNHGPAAPPAGSPAASPTAGGVFAPGATGAPATPATPPATGGSTKGDACTDNGAVKCNGKDKFGLCNNGSIVWQSVAPGTMCVDGAITKRSASRIARQL